MKNNQSTSSKETTNIGETVTLLKSLQNKEIKPHMLQHTPHEIRQISGFRKTRDTQEAERFIGHEGLKDLWPRISKRYGTDKLELLQRSASISHSRALYNTWSTKGSSQQQLQNQERIKSLATYFERIQYHSNNKYNNQKSVRTAIHGSINTDNIQKILHTFFKETWVKGIVHSLTFEMFQAWIREERSSRYATFLCKGISIEGNKEYEKFVVHADNNCPGIKSSNNVREITIPAFSVLEAEIYDPIIKQNSTQVVRVLAIVQFASFSRPNQKGKRVFEREEIVCIVGLMRKCSGVECLLPYDIYEYQADEIDKTRMKISCCHVSQLKKPVFHIAINPIEIHNYAKSVHNQYFYIITIDRWQPKLDQGRVYDEYYCKKDDIRSGWSCFNEISTIATYKENEEQKRISY
jgi:hypothetical protein